MLNIDRMEFPKKYRIPNWIKLLVIVLVFAGILIQNCTQDSLDKEIEISNVRIADYSRVHVEVDYTIWNKSGAEKDAWLLLKVFDENDKVLASSLFMVKLKAGEKKNMPKILDKLDHPLEGSEKPKNATLEIYKRKVLS